MDPQQLIDRLESLHTRARFQGHYLLVVTPSGGGIYSQAHLAGDGVEVQFWNEQEPRNRTRIPAGDLPRVQVRDTGLQVGRIEARIASVPMVS